MARIYIRLLASLFALAVLVGTGLGAYYIYRETYLPEKQRTAEVKTLLSTTGPKADPGKKEFDQAMAMIRQGEMETAKQLLTEITEVYRDSERYPDSLRVLGEMNLDRLFSRAPMPGKLEYTAARGDSLHEIAKRFRTTLGYIKRVNNLLGSVIHPDDRIVVYPLDFDIKVDLANKQLTLLQEGRFFKAYPITGHHLPYPSLPAQTTVGDKPAWIDNKKIQTTDERYYASRKWLQTAGKSSKPGIIFRGSPQPAVPVADPALPGGATPVPAVPPPASADKTPGIYLNESDIEELSTLVRVGTPVQFLKKPAPPPAGRS